MDIIFPTINEEEVVTRQYMACASNLEAKTHWVQCEGWSHVIKNQIYVLENHSGTVKYIEKANPQVIKIMDSDACKDTFYKI